MPLTPRAIVQCTREGKDIKAFPTISDACKELGITNKERIYKSIRHGVVAFGYRWRYADEPLAEPQGYGMRLKPIIATKDGVDKEYSNIVVASNEIGATISHIQEAILTGGVAKGYRFRMKGTEPKKKKDRHRKTVYAIDDDGNVVKEWPCVYDAAADLGVIPAAIYLTINPKRPEARCKGYRLRYKENL